MAERANFTAKLRNLGYLRELVAEMGFVLTRGRGAGREGSIKQFLDHLSAGEVVAFPVIREAAELFEAAVRFERLAADEYPGGPAQDLLRAAARALRTAAARVAELDEPDGDGYEESGEAK